METEPALWAVALWLGFALLSFLHGLARRFHTIQWLVLSVVLGPLALLLGLFLQGRGPRVSLFSRRRRSETRDERGSIGDLFDGKPLFQQEIGRLKSEGRLDEAEELLLMLVDAVEEKARELGRPPRSWYYYQLAVLYRRQGQRDKERSILERLAAHPVKDGAAQRLLQRLDRLRERQEVSPGDAEPPA